MLVKKKDFCIVIPAYNEEGRIEKVLSKINKYNVIVVDDGSTDNTYKIAKKYIKKVYRHKINLGKGSALKTGCEAAIRHNFKNIVIMDSDGQHKPKDLNKILNPLLKNKKEVVLGVRKYGNSVPLIRYLGNKIASVIINLLFGIYVTDLLCGYRGFTSKAYKKIEWKSRGYGIETEMVINIAKNKIPYCEVEIENVYYDKFKGVSIFDSMEILLNVIKWKIK